MKPILSVLFVVFLYLQYRLWIGDGSIAALVQLQDAIEKQDAENSRLHERNRLLAAEVLALKTDTDAIEERARTDLGMIKKGETFYMVVQPPAVKKSTNTL